MKKLLTIITALLFFANMFAQTSNDFIVIDEIAENLESLKKQYNGQNVYLTSGVELDAISQITNAIKSQQVENIHIFVPTKPGAIVFSSVAVVNSNVNKLASELTNWKSNISGQVIIHSDNVFNGESGMKLKQELERLTGLIFTTINN
tara:strand:+ start:217 stop:660 length:444 start_codon:yes stop_codon:yes gene_type:complete